jgi:hypothetical protein
LRKCGGGTREFSKPDRPISLAQRATSYDEDLKLTIGNTRVGGIFPTFVPKMGIWKQKKNGDAKFEYFASPVES